MRVVFRCSSAGQAAYLAGSQSGVGTVGMAGGLLSSILLGCMICYGLGWRFLDTLRLQSIFLEKTNSTLHSCEGPCKGVADDAVTREYGYTRFGRSDHIQECQILNVKWVTCVNIGFTDVGNNVGKRR